MHEFKGCLILANPLKYYGISISYKKKNYTIPGQKWGKNVWLNKDLIYMVGKYSEKN